MGFVFVHKMNTDTFSEYGVEAQHSVFGGVDIDEAHFKMLKVVEDDAAGSPDGILATACSLKSSGQTIGSSSWTSVTFGTDTEQSDQRDWHSESVNTHVITVDQSGWYLLLTYLNWDSNTSGERQTRFVVADQGGSTAFATYDKDADGDDRMVNHWLGYLDSSDAVHLEVWQDSGFARGVDLAEFKAIKLK